ncbi:hypothetical protein GCM10027446_24570 [Angustibacter peucedani]
MDVVYRLVVLLHLLGMAALVGSYLTVLHRPRVLGIMRDAAGVQLVTGLALVGLVESGAVDHDPLDHAKIAVKLVVAAVVLAVAVVGARRDRGDHAPDTGRSTDGLAHVVGGLALVNVAVAVLWT